MKGKVTRLQLATLLQKGSTIPGSRRLCTYWVQWIINFRPPSLLVTYFVYKSVVIALIPVGLPLCRLHTPHLMPVRGPYSGLRDGHPDSPSEPKDLFPQLLGTLTSDGFQLSALSGNCTRLKRVAKPNVRPAFQGSLHLMTGKGYKCSVLLPQLGTTLQAISASELPWGQLRSLLRWQNGSASLSAQFCLLP